jgi:hypothetical protein
MRNTAGPARPVLRFAGLPAHSLRRLSRPDFAARLTDLRERADRERAEGDALADELHTTIGGLPPGDLKPALVGLRRALHQGRLPGVREWNARTAAAVGVELGERIDRWITDRRVWRIAFDHLPAALRADTIELQETLRQVIADPGFRRALRQAGPTLLDEAGKWIADPGRRPKAQKLLRLARYVSRAAAKTSPYSTFMTSGPATWADGDTTPVRPAGAATRTVLELDGGYLAQIRAALVAEPGLKPAARVRINPSAEMLDGRIRFLGRPPQEPIVTVDATPVVREILRLCAASPDLTWADLVAWAARSIGAEPARIAAFADRLVASTLLELAVPVPELGPDPLAALADWAEPAGLATPIRAVRRELRAAVPVADAQGHRDRMARLHVALAHLTSRLSLTPVDEPVHEVAVLDGVAGTCGTAYWGPVLADLDVTRRFLAIFDRKLPVRLAVGAYAAERFGAGARVPLLTLYRSVQEELAGTAEAGDVVHDLRHLLGPAAPWDAPLGRSRTSRLRELDALRAEALRAVTPESGPSRVVRVTPEDLDKVVAEWPEWITVPDSIGCYVQALPGDGPVRAVLNAVHGGHGRGWGRLAHLGAAVPAGELHVTGGSGSVLAELGGLLGSTLNSRPAEAPYEIDYPFTVSGRPAAERLAPAAMIAAHCARTGLLELTAASAPDPIEVVHLGMSSDAALPPLARFLERVFGRAYLVHPGSPPLVQLERFTPASGASAGVVRHPRIECGQVVLQRARWFTPAGEVPVRDGGEDEAHYLFRLAQWRHRHGLPDGCYVRMWSNDVGAGRVKDRKPTYVDFANPLLVMDFERHVRTADFLLFDEALPDPLAADGHVTEVFVQVPNSRADD